ncbi:SsrA-binding protein SmpB [Coprothermobacteraceae bacterium]|nr:SsrA-binding protein SmpB [Coprothermobacteraceae bacterium]
MKKVLAQNKRASHDYQILDTYEAGIVLTGDEVKSARNGGANLRDSFVRIENGEAWLYNMHIAPYTHTGLPFRSDPKRKRKLLLHKSEINKIMGYLTQKGLTAVPLSMYLSDRGLIKLLIGIAKGKKTVDKRESIKQRDIERELRREHKFDY